jgi:hypothetical protein
MLLVMSNNDDAGSKSYRSRLAVRSKACVVCGALPMICRCASGSVDVDFGPNFFGRGCGYCRGPTDAIRWSRYSSIRFCGGLCTKQRHQCHALWSTNESAGGGILPCPWTAWWPISFGFVTGFPPTWTQSLCKVGAAPPSLHPCTPTNVILTCPTDDVKATRVL